MLPLIALSNCEGISPFSAFIQRINQNLRQRLDQLVKVFLLIRGRYAQ